MSFEPTDFWLWFLLGYGSRVTVARREWKSRSYVKVKGQSKYVPTSVYLGGIWDFIGGHSSRFPLWQSATACRNARRSAADTSGSGRFKPSARGCGKLVTRSVWPRSSIDDSFSSLAHPASRKPKVGYMFRSCFLSHHTTIRRRKCMRQSTFLLVTLPNIYRFKKIHWQTQQ